MIKNLKKRFITVAMAAVSVLLIVLLGAINIFNIIISNNQINKKMDFLAVRSMGNFQSVPQVDMFSGGPYAPKDFFGKPMDEDTARESRHFSVLLDGNGEIAHIDTKEISSVDEAQAREICEKVLLKNSSKGYIAGFKYTTAAVGDIKSASYNQVMIFLDVSNQYQSILAVLFLSLSFGILAWGLMLLFVFVLSDKAIKPIAENIQRQKMFITNAGHEIKTPLAIISANAEALELHQGESKWTQNIKGQTARLSDLMQKLLFLSKADESSIFIEKHNIDLTSLLTEIIAPYDELLKKEEKIINANIEKTYYLGNTDSICQLFSVLVDNAVKYALPGSSIDISLKSAGKILFKVKNQCEQLPLVSPERLFDRFYRGDTARTQSSGGYGIGLSVARAITESCGGKIYAEYYENNTIEFVVEL